MPIIQGAVAAGSGAARGSGLTLLTTQQRRHDISLINRIGDTLWSLYPVRDGFVKEGVRVRHRDEVDEALEDDGPGSPELQPQPDPPTPCCFGLISDGMGTRKAIMEFFEDPSSSTGAWVTSIVVLLCIVISTITIILESMPTLRTDGDKANFFIVECICIAVFSIEYAVRWIAVPAKCSFMISPMNFIDLIAILPFYVDMIMLLFGTSAELDLLRLLRLFRIFRIFKLSKYSSGIVICANALYESKDTLGLMIFMCSIIVIIFGSFVYFFEGGTWNEETRVYEYSDGTPTLFISIPASMWWTIVTVMTVGYGDMSPQTELGKFTAAVAMVCSIVIMALPISVIGSNFSRAWMEKKEQDDMESGDGRRLSYCFSDLLTSLIKHNSLMEEVLHAGTAQLDALHKELKKVQKEYAALHPDARETTGPADAQSGDLAAMMQATQDLCRQDSKLQAHVRNIVRVQDSAMEREAVMTAERLEQLEDYILRYQEISANIIGLEQVVFGHSISVCGR